MIFEFWWSQINLQRGSFNAKKLAQKIQEDPVDLSAAKEFVKSLEKPKPIFSHATFTRIQNETDLSDNKMNVIAQIIREEAGRTAIEPGWAEALKVNGQKTAPYFVVEEILFEGKDEKPRKRHLVYCPKPDKFEDFIKGQS